MLDEVFKKIYQDEQKQFRQMLKLISKFNRRNITETEIKKLDEWILESDLNMSLFEIFTDKHNKTAFQEIVDSLKGRKPLTLFS